jgi:hypothetical protein
MHDAPTEEYEYQCSQCGATVDEHDKFCRQCGTDTSEVIDKADNQEELIGPDAVVNGDLSPPPQETPTVNPKAIRSGLIAAAIILFAMAASQFLVNSIINARMQSPGASTLPINANIVIGVGLLRRNGVWGMSQNGYRVWAIIRCFATPVIILVEAVRNNEPSSGLHFPEISLVTGLATILIGPPPSNSRIALGFALSIFGFVGVALIGGGLSPH